MNRWVVSSQVLTQSYSIDKYIYPPRNRFPHLPICSSIHPNGHVLQEQNLLPPPSDYPAHEQAWTDG